MNKFKKYCESVFVMETEEQYDKGDIAEIETKYGKTVEVEVYNLVGKNNGFLYYSIVRIDDKSYAERKAERYNNSAERHILKSDKYYEASKEGAEFLKLAEPIKIGHHSEHRHRALIERNYKRMGNSVKERAIAEEKANKAEYWEKKALEINLSMPESLEFYLNRLENATAYHKGLKDGTTPKEHSYSVQYANKAVKDLTRKVDLAKKLWSN